MLMLMSFRNALWLRRMEEQTRRREDDQRLNLLADKIVERLNDRAKSSLTD
jgi:hypothetical protein